MLEKHAEHFIWKMRNIIQKVKLISISCTCSFRILVGRSKEEGGRNGIGKVDVYIISYDDDIHMR